MRACLGVCAWMEGGGFKMDVNSLTLLYQEMNSPLLEYSLDSKE